MSDSKKPALKPPSPWQHLLDLKKQHQTFSKFGGAQPKTKAPVPRFMPKGRSGSK